MTLISAPWVLAVVAWTATWMTSRLPPLMQPRCVCVLRQQAAELCSLLVVGWREVICGKEHAHGWGRALHQLASMRADSGVMTTWGDGMGEEQHWWASTWRERALLGTLHDGVPGLPRTGSMYQGAWQRH